MYRRIVFIFSLLNDCIVNLPEMKINDEDSKFSLANQIPLFFVAD